MGTLTSWHRLDELAGVLERHAAQLEDARARLRAEVEASHGYWRGVAGENFRRHTGAGHRQHHLRVAATRLREAAWLARAAAAENRLQDHASAGRAG